MLVYAHRSKLVTANNSLNVYSEVGTTCKMSNDAGKLCIISLLLSWHWISMKEHQGKWRCVFVYIGNKRVISRGNKHSLKLFWTLILAVCLKGCLYDWESSVHLSNVEYPSIYQILQLKGYHLLDYSKLYVCPILVKCPQWLNSKCTCFKNWKKYLEWNLSGDLYA